MANSNRDTSDYVRSAYRRPGHKRPDYGRSKSRGQIWSIIIVLLLIVILAGGAVWMYLGRGGEELEVASTESEEALTPQTATSAPAETEALPPDVAEEEMAATAPPEEASQAGEDEFASILEELGIDAAEEPGETEEEKAAGTEAEFSESVPEEEAVVAAPEIPSREQAEEEMIGDFSTPEERSGMMAQERGGQATDQLNEVAGMASPGEQAAGESPESPRLGETSQEIEELPAVVGSPERGGATAALPELAVPELAIDEGVASRAPETVTVQSGDSLSIIAQRVYGDPGKWTLIYDANRDVLESPDLLLVGMELTIPPEGG